MPELLLALNAGSTGLRFALFERGSPPRAIERGFASFRDAELIWTRLDGRRQSTRLPPGAVTSAPTSCVSALIGLLGVEIAATGRLIGIGHRFAEGADDAHAAACILDETTSTRLGERSRQSPWQLPAALALAKAAITRWPKLPHVACFDTSAHGAWSDHAMRFSVAADWHERHLRRRGGHGLSIGHALDVLAHELPSARRTVVAHLGATSSVTAVAEGRAIDSTMGYSSIDGLPMQTHAGDMEPGAILNLLRHHAHDAFKLEELLARKGGLAALSGLSGDFRELLVSESEEARFAIDHFSRKIAEAVARMGTVLGGVDALVFTGGIGAGSAELRALVVDRLAWIGASMNPAANARQLLRIHDGDSRIAIFAIEANEERQIAIETQTLIDLS